MGAFLLMFHVFQSTPSSRRETCSRRGMPHGAKYFNPLPPRGGRREAGGMESVYNDISIHSLLAEGDLSRRTRPRRAEDISIHSLLAEGDGRRLPQSRENHPISIHSLLAEGDLTVITV